jgi:copper chaperone
MQESFKVPDVSCDHCKDAIESALRPLAGIRAVLVDIEDKTTTVDFDHEIIDRSAVMAVIENEGYHVSP